jgi:hypothetical protein
MIAASLNLPEISTAVAVSNFRVQKYNSATLLKNFFSAEFSAEPIQQPANPLFIEDTEK